MTSLLISLPETLKAYVDERVASGEFSTPEDFIRNLICEDRERKLAGIEAELLEALQSRELTVSLDELNDHDVVSVLRGKLGRP